MIIDAPSYTDIPALRELWREAFGDSDEFLDGFFKTAFSPERSRCARENGNVFAMLYWFDCECDGESVAYLYAIATAKAYRGRGISTALLKDTHKILKKKGYTGAVLVPGTPELFGFYGKIGYKTATFVNEHSVSAVKTGLSVKKISKEDYARLRRVFLPVGAVVQEKENLDFLDTEATFYTGDGFLLAARADGRTLFGIELLGNTAKAADIVGALGLGAGKFRTPGNERAFAMYLPFDERQKTPPTYFGLAFD